VSAPSHPRAVGAFVLGGLLLILVAVAGLGGGYWLAPADRFVVFFPGSVRGLRAGAPVSFRGVDVGQVVDVRAFLTGKPDPPLQIEVVLELRRDRFEAPPGVPRPWARLRDEELARRLTDAGLRAQLLSQSLLTGQKYVELDFNPELPPRLSGFAREHPELPTAASGLERLGDRGERFLEQIAALPIEETVAELRKTLRSLDALAGSKDLHAAIGNARRATAELRPTIVESRQALAELRALTRTAEREIAGTSREAAQTARRVREAVDHGERTLQLLERTALSTDEARIRATEAIEDLSRTLAALRHAAEYIQRQPESLVLGKPGPGEGSPAEERR
jgi:paraquat-inducible protein B